MFWVCMQKSDLVYFKFKVSFEYKNVELFYLINLINAILCFVR